VTSTRQDFASIISSDLTVYLKVIEDAGINVEVN
jgi:hypothetical protein